MKRVIRLLLVSAVMLLFALLTTAFVVSPPPWYSGWKKSQAVTVFITEQGATGFRYSWDETRETKKVKTKTIVRSRSATLDVPGFPSGEHYLHIQPLELRVNGRTANVGTQKRNDPPYQVDKIKPEMPSAQVRYEDSGRHSMSATINIFIDQTPGSHLSDRNMHVMVHPGARGRKLTVASPGTYYYCLL